jgi:hypothetical protein
MKWFVVILIMCGLFYAATRLMPSATAIDTLWMSRQVRVGMSQEEVESELGGRPNSIMKGGIGKQETWYYTDRYDSNRQLGIDFVDGRVFRYSVEPPFSTRR